MHSCTIYRFTDFFIQLLFYPGECSKPNVTANGLKFIEQEQTEETYRIGSEVKLDSGFE